jgi:hypothetical protein
VKLCGKVKVVRAALVAKQLSIDGKVGLIAVAVRVGLSLALQHEWLDGGQIHTRHVVVPLEKVCCACGRCCACVIAVYGRVVRAQCVADNATIITEEMLETGVTRVEIAYLAVDGQRGSRRGWRGARRRSSGAHAAGA